MMKEINPQVTVRRDVYVFVLIYAWYCRSPYVFYIWVIVFSLQGPSDVPFGSLPKHVIFLSSFSHLHLPNPYNLVQVSWSHIIDVEQNEFEVIHHKSPYAFHKRKNRILKHTWASHAVRDHSALLLHFAELPHVEVSSVEKRSITTRVSISVLLPVCLYLTYNSMLLFDGTEYLVM